jgi:beta-xylosidase
MKPVWILFSALVLLAAGCSAQPSTTPVPATSAPTPLPPPSETPLPPTLTPEPPTATAEPSPTPDPLLLRDDFEGALAEGWSWTRENPESWSLSSNPGWLEITVGFGSVGSGNLDNMLLRPIPEGNFEIETRMNFRPSGDFQLAGILIYESASNFIQFGRAFCDLPNTCAGDGFYVDMVSGGNLDPDNLSIAAPDAEIVFLRLRREGSLYTAYASADGETWRLIGEKVSEMKPLFMGLVAGQAWSAPEEAQFDYFLVNQLP